ncbi:ATP-binding cassette domain-containing protein [Nakamurella endophytica]|uniref:Daunorubicin resistance protein DrrA family ABC transporter ATP-binding protein n=1 Tax=Nakamurella endophytica TaxID=1748367 RepID=A0A917SY65_9ACTN|nr:ATP-binding cassette domain-containing protein [Nakamurella endophytica]GGM02213.1 daunorubicin resistance protein DrrA family ABC transporter ATP-binding protein [Nakamurella endophytica]
MTDIIEVEGLLKRFKETTALAGVDFTVPQGTVLGLLGPNGAGKTTAVRILATLLPADGGRAVVAGYDVATQPAQVRSRIGLTGQYAAVDEYLTGAENLEMIGRLYRLGRSESRRRAGDLLERFDLVDAAGRPAKTYSGGMRRRLDIAASLIARPPVLFLDEPTTGLDPRSRQDMWEFIAALVQDGTTILLTTQYLEEADRLADSMVVIDHGTVIARGTGDQLKAAVGGQRLEFTVADAAMVAVVAERLAPLGIEPPRVDQQTRTVTLPVSGGAEVLATALARLDGAAVELVDVGLRRPDLDDVFLALTGHAAEDGTGTPDATSGTSGANSTDGGPAGGRGTGSGPGGPAPGGGTAGAGVRPAAPATGRHAAAETEGAHR